MNKKTINKGKSWKNNLTNNQRNQIDKLDAIVYAKILSIIKEFFNKPKNVSVTDATGCNKAFVNAIAREFREVDVFLSRKPNCDDFKNYQENNVTIHPKYVPKSNNKFNNSNTNKMIATTNHVFYAEPRAIKQPRGFTYNIGRYAIYNISNQLKDNYKLAVFRLKKDGTHFAHLISKFEDVSNKIYLRSVSAKVGEQTQHVLLLIVDLTDTNIKISIDDDNKIPNTKPK